MCENSNLEKLSLKVMHNQRVMENTMKIDTLEFDF